MADTNFTAGTIVASTWLDDVNTNTYAILNAVSAGPNNITAIGATTVTVGYPRGVAFRFIPQANNTGPMTINISGLGVRPITKMGAIPLRANDVLAGAWAYIAYDGTQFQLINPMTNATGQLIGVQTFIANGTYTPTVGTTRILVRGVGAGGAGGGAGASAAGQIAIGGGGGAGGTGETFLTSGFSGAAVVVGAGGTGVAGLAGNPGGSSSFGAFMTLGGGAGGGASVAGAVAIVGGGAGGTSSGGNILANAGQQGFAGAASFASGYLATGIGASGPYGGGGGPNIAAGASSSNGLSAFGRGGGGGGAFTFATVANTSGGTGTGGLFIVYEYS